MKKIIITIFISIFAVTSLACTNKEQPKDSTQDNKNSEEKVNTITKLEIKKENNEEKVEIFLNGKEHNFILKEDDNNKVVVTFDDQEILSFERTHYSETFTSDSTIYKTIKGTDDKYYFAFAMSNFYLSSYQQYLYIFNDEGKIIHHVEDFDFGAAFTDYEDITSFSDMYGDTGRYKLEDDKIIYLEFFNYTPSEDFVRCQENIMTIDNNKINTEQGDIIKVAMMS